LIRRIWGAPSGITYNTKYQIPEAVTVIGQFINKFSFKAINIFLELHR
jgi:hypothetical protein